MLRRGKGEARQQAPVRRYDLTWPEEIVFALIFAGGFFAIRGVYGIPMLMAAGSAGVVTFLAWKLWRLRRDADVRLHRFQLKRQGRVSRAGKVYAIVTALVLALCVHSGLVNAAEGVGWLHYRAVSRSLSLGEGGEPTLSPEAVFRAERAQRFYGLASSFADGGIALATNPRIDYRRAWLHAACGEYMRAETLLKRVIAGQGENEAMARDMSRVLRAQRRTDDVLDHTMQMIGAHPEWVHLLDEVMRWCVTNGNVAKAEVLCSRLRDQQPDDAHVLFWHALTLAQLDRLQEAREAAGRAAALEPADAELRENIEGLVRMLGQ